MKTPSRAFTIAFRIGGYLAWLAARELGFAGRGSPSRRFAVLLEGLGTPFVKLGQHLSLRSDLFPLEFVAALQNLQDHVQPFDPALAAREIEEGGGIRLQYETAIAATEWRRLLATIVRHVRRRGPKLEIEHEGLPELASTHLKAANRVSVALVTPGLYLAASLLMQHSLGPVAGGVPIFAVLGYMAAVWHTIRLIRAVGKGL